MPNYAELRHLAAKFWKLPQLYCVPDKEFAKRERSIRGVQRHIPDNGSKITAGRG